MKFYEIVDQVAELLQRRGRVAYRALKVEFELNDEQLAVLKEEFIDIQELAVDKEGKMLVWVGNTEGNKDKRITDKEINGETENHDPSRWTPPHLAERIRATVVTDGERKTITALFADLKGSTALIEGLDPEEARAIIDPALQLMMDAVHRYEGYVAQALGDGIFALFGAPLAHEDHPQRALYAALRMQEEMRRYGDQVRLKHGVPLTMRVGLNTGEVVVRSIRKDDLHTDYVPVGHSTNLAARMEQMATPGSILISEHTRKLVEGFFELKALGATQIKGVEEPLQVYEVVGTGPLRTRLQVTATRRGLTRFIGRQRELEQMQYALAQAKAGHGQIVSVMGEPGLGKSRLFYEFQLLSRAGCLILEAYSVSHGKASPYLPVIELLKSYFDIQPQDEERKRREKVTGKVLTLDRSLEDALPYLFALLGIEEQPSLLQQMDPQIRRKRTFDAIKKLFLRESLNQPLVLIFEDLHWIDSETQGFLEVLTESVASAKVLLLVNYRPEYRSEWGQKTYYTQVRLSPFGKAEAEEFLDVLLGATSLQTLKHLILEKTEGTPFFMEEVVQELRERDLLSDPGGVGTAHLQVLPTTVQGILAARIDRLVPDEKALLQQLAVIGREFPLRLAKQVVTQSEDNLYHLLASLQHKEFLYEQPAFPEVEYLFKHALTQEVAYGSVLHERRKALHEQTAKAVEALYHERLDDHYSDLAYHYSRSENAQKAVEYLHLAGQQSVQRSANVEAISHLTTALVLLKTLPDTLERTQQELTLQIALSEPLQATKGLGAPEVGKAYTRAFELCRQVGETTQLFPALRGLWQFSVVRAKLQTAHELGEQLLSLAHHIQDTALLAEAHRTLGEPLLWLGDLTRARAYLEQGIILYDSQQHRSHALLYGLVPGVTCPSFVALVLWLLGYPDQALKRSREALALARELSSPLNLSFARAFAAWLHQFRREWQATQEQTTADLILSTEQGLALQLAMGLIHGGWVLVEQGQGKEGVAQMRQGLNAFRGTGAEVTQPYYLALLAEAYGKVEQAEDGLTALAEALEAVDRTGERYYEAELYRLKGELTLQSSVQSLESRVKEAEEYFLKAVRVANTQHAKSLELRAVMSMSRLWQQQGKRAEAHKLLSEIYGWFTEGFDTKDLREAKALVEALR